jgi:hypothetical protein
MAKEKEPKFLAKYDPATDRLKPNGVFHKKPTVGELILALKCASVCNELGIRWGINSPFQRKIEDLCGPRPYGDVKEDIKDAV